MSTTQPTSAPGWSSSPSGGWNSADFESQRRRLERELQQDLGERNFDQLRRLLVRLNGTLMVQEFRHTAGLRKDMPNGPSPGNRRPVVVGPQNGS